MVLSKSIRDYCTDEIHKAYFLAYEGAALTLPNKFRPAKEFLARHCEKLIR